MGNMSTLPFLRRDVPDGRGELRISRGIHRPVPDPGARRVLAKEVVSLPVRRRPDRPRDEPAAAVRADVVQDALDAACAKRALITADACFERVWRAELQHRHRDRMLSLPETDLLPPAQGRGWGSP